MGSIRAREQNKAKKKTTKETEYIVQKMTYPFCTQAFLDSEGKKIRKEDGFSVWKMGLRNEVVEGEEGKLCRRR